jgi:hypothetical protein
MPSATVLMPRLLRHRHRRLDLHAVVMARVGLADERAVDPDRVHGRLVQAGERRIAGAEIVQRERDADGLQFVQALLHLLVLRGQAFRHLQQQLVRAHAVLVQHVAHAWSARLTAPERPAAWTFGPRLPRQASGKGADWIIDAA